MPNPAISGLTIVLNGSFNPATFHPSWLENNKLITREAAKYAVGTKSDANLVVSPQFTSFDADWLNVQARQEQLVLSIAEESKEEDLRDFADGLMNLLPESPMDAMGINYLAHYRMSSEERWHEIGDAFAPKAIWEGIVPDGSWAMRPDGTRIGMLNISVQVQRGEDQPAGLLRIDIAPSVRIQPHGVFVQINDHFAVPKGDGERGSAGEYALLLSDQWTSVRGSQSTIIQRIEELL